MSALFQAIPEVGSVTWCSVFAAPERGGGTTAVVRLPSWPDAGRLLEIARASGVVETTFVLLNGARFELRFFTAETEVPLCGHGALAATATFAAALDEEPRCVDNLPGKIWVWREQGAVVSFARAALREVSATALAVRVPAVRAFDAGRDYLLVVESVTALKALRASELGAERLDKVGCLVAARDTGGAIAFRFFAPRAGIPEDHASVSVIPALVAHFGFGQDHEREFRQESGGGLSIRAFARGERVAVTGDVLVLGHGRLSSAGAISISRSSATADEPRGEERC
jgi:predicted PhzF superfamily epimerase YddE/YHI9